MIATNRLYEIDPGVLKQAAVWALGGLTAAKLTQDKAKSVGEESKNRKKLAIQGLVGGAAGAAGALV